MNQLATVLLILLAVMLVINVFQPEFEFLEIPDLGDCGCGPEEEEAGRCVC